MQPLLDIPLYSQFAHPVSGLRVTANRGLLGGYVQCGDGATAGTFPTMLPLTVACRKGMSFDGGDYLVYANALASNTYTVCMLVQRTSSAGSKYLCDGRAGGGTGYLWIDAGSVLAASSGTTYVDDAASTSLPVGPLCFVACSGLSIAAPSGLYLASNFVAASNLVGNMYGVTLWSGSRTPRELSDIRQRMLAETFGP